MVLKKKREGFTLIELVVVISIILIFAGFLIPKFAGYQTKAKDTKAINTAKQIQSAALSSYSEMDGKFEASAVSDSISALTGAEGVLVTINGGKSVEVSFTSDTVTYTVKIEDTYGTFTVYKEGTEVSDQIYPKS